MKGLDLSVETWVLNATRKDFSSFITGLQRIRFPIASESAS